MALSTTIRLSNSITPKFPQRCVFSGEVNPDGFGYIVAHGGNPLVTFFVPLMHLFGWKKIAFPLKKKYTTKFYVHYYFREVILWVIVGFAVFYFMPMFEKTDPLRKIKVGGLALASLVPYVVFEIAFARPFDITVYSKYTDYEFKSESYAREFMELNPGSEEA